MTLEFIPIHKDFGAEVRGADLTLELSEEAFSEIYAAYFRYGLLLFRGERLTPAQQAAFTARFGEPKIAPRKQFNVPDQQEISVLGNLRAEDGTPLAFLNRQGVEWHSDTAGNEDPDGITFLHAIEVPRAGGETMFCSMVAAWEMLSDERKADIAGRKVLHSFNHHNDKVLRIGPGTARPLTPEERAKYPDIWHDLVQVHPVTGRTLYFASHNLVKAVTGVEGDPDAAESWIMELIDHATRPERVYVHAWSPGDLLMWDNRAMMHSATDVGPYEEDRRIMYRSSCRSVFTGAERVAD